MSPVVSEVKKLQDSLSQIMAVECEIKTIVFSFQEEKMEL
jgi:hypothetical protein